MGLEPTFSMSDIRKALRQQFSDKLYTIYLRALRIVGERAIEYARSLNTYQDQTGNLRSSIGYAIYYNGGLVDRNFKKVKDGSEGMSEGEKHAARKIPRSGFVLVVVAGMDYALAVQSRGYDVLDGAEIEAEKVLTRQLNSIKHQIDQWKGSGA